ncbi:MAG: hypothetical protein WCG09_09260 [Halobacteriota archaeon]
MSSKFASGQPYVVVLSSRAAPQAWNGHSDKRLSGSYTGTQTLVIEGYRLKPLASFVACTFSVAQVYHGTIK